MKELVEKVAELYAAFEKDATDRNRTSPFAFTGNKFEFRMVGSTQSISCLLYTSPSPRDTR